MEHFILLSFVVVLAFPAVFCVPSYGGFVPVLQGFPGGGYQKKPLVLTCAVNFTDYYKKDVGIVNAISVTIKEKGASYGSTKPSLLSYVGYGGLTGSGLTATIDIYSAIGGPVSVAFTERARPERGCFSDDFGPFLTPNTDISALNIGGYGGYGGYAGYNGYGAAGYGGYNNYGYGQGGGLGALGAMYGGSFGGGYGYFGSGYGDGAKVPGVVAKVNVAPGTASSINIDNLEGFSYLKELAGRGVVVCPTKAVDRGYQGTACEGGILACCALHYDQGDQNLPGKYDGY